MKKIVVLGSNGMAGHMITLFLESLNKYDVYNICHQKKLNDKSIVLDVIDQVAFFKTLDSIRPDIIINCIGILNDKSDKDIVYTKMINTILPKSLETYYQDTDTKIIHLSTNCVFKGSNGPYSEYDNKDATDTYGISKSLGEIDNDKDLTIRTSIIGPELKYGKGLFDWFMRQSEEILGYNQEYWSGVTTLELAHIIDKMIEQNIVGIYNLSPREKISKYNLLNLFKEIFKKDIIIKEDNQRKVDKSLITKRNDFEYHFNDYYKMIENMKLWMEKHSNYYDKYLNKDKVIIIWSKIKANKFEDEKEAYQWVVHRMKIFMTYTTQSFKNQTNQHFYYFINYDEKAKDIILKELAKYPPLPSNIIFTDHYYVEINKIIPYYQKLYFVRIDSDDMYQKEFIEKLMKFHPKKETEALIAQKGYIYDTSNNALAHWFYTSPPFYTLIYDTKKFASGFRYDIHGHSSVIKLKHEIIDGDNFVVIVHGQNTVTKFNSSFRKEIIDDELTKQRIIDDFNLRLLHE